MAARKRNLRDEPGPSPSIAGEEGEKRCRELKKRECQGERESGNLVPSRVKGCAQWASLRGEHRTKAHERDEVRGAKGQCCNINQQGFLRGCTYHPEGGGERYTKEDDADFLSKGDR